MPATWHAKLLPRPQRKQQKEEKKEIHAIYRKYNKFQSCPMPPLELHTANYPIEILGLGSSVARQWWSKEQQIQPHLMSLFAIKI
jgi:hypothetical protein